MGIGRNRNIEKGLAVLKILSIKLHSEPEILLPDTYSGGIR